MDGSTPPCSLKRPIQHVYLVDNDDTTNVLKPPLDDDQHSPALRAENPRKTQISAVGDESVIEGVCRNGNGDVQCLSTSTDSEDTALVTVRRLFGALYQTETLPAIFQRVNDARSGESTQLQQIAELFHDHGIRTSLVLAPQPALSLYRDSLVFPPTASSVQQQQHGPPDYSLEDPVRLFWIILLGLHPHQEAMERLYATALCETWCVLQTIHFLVNQRSTSTLARRLLPNDSTWKILLQTTLHQCHTDLERFLFSMLDAKTYSTNSSSGFNASSPVGHWTNLLNDSEMTRDQQYHLRDLHQRVCAQNCTLSNLCWQQWNQMACRMERMDHHPSSKLNFERFKLYLSNDGVSGGPVATVPSLLPSLSLVLTQGVEYAAKSMVESFWSHLWIDRHYRATSELREGFSPHLQQFFASGLLPPGHEQQNALPSRIPLIAHFAPTYPLSVYLHGPSGAGKSSLVRHFASALQATLVQHVDPRARVETVKQLLNKPLSILELELELRRNNNDMSLSAILASRCEGGLKRSGKSMLAVLALEELAPPMDGNIANHVSELSDPNQSATIELLCERLSGQTGPHRSYSHVRCNGEECRGVSGDKHLVSIFTSNYELQPDNMERLRRLKMFENLQRIRMVAMEVEDRRLFAESYLRRQVMELWKARHRNCIAACRQADHTAARPSTKASPDSFDFELTRMPLGSGDIRPLVRHLRMLAFYTCKLRNDVQLCQFGQAPTTSMRFRIVQDGLHCSIASGTKSLKLRVGSMDNLYPVDAGSFFDDRTRLVLESMRNSSMCCCYDLSVIIDFWWTGTLAPVVVLSKDSSSVQCLVGAMREIQGVHVLSKLVAGSYKMMRSLYDPINTPNLRDDIKGLGKGAFAVIELICADVDAQLCIREMIEDTPSLTAYSTDRSALRKEGLFFLVHIQGDIITQELLSRASWIL